MKSKVTLKEIAIQAGVNASTVSRVLNNASGCSISDAVRQRVLAIAEANQYALNHSARMLASQRSFTLGILLGSQLELDFMSPCSSLILSAFIREAFSRGYHTVILPMSNRDFDKEVRDTIRASLADAYWVGTDMIGTKTLDELKQRGVPVACYFGDLEPKVPLEAIEVFGVELKTAFHTLFRTLQERGFESYAFLYRQDETVARLARYELYDLDREYGLRRADSICYESPRHDFPMLLDTIRIAEELWPRFEKHRLILCANDLMALGIREAMHRRGLVPGRDISLVGLDNIEENVGFQRGPEPPELATFDFPWTKIGQEMARTLIHRLQEPASEPVPHRMFPATFIPRSSLGSAVKCLHHQAK